MRTFPTPPGEAEPLPQSAPRPPFIGLRYAVAGIAHAYQSQRNFRIQAVFALLAGLLTCILPVGPFGVGLIALTCAGVLGAELLNSAIEALVDLASPALHPLAKQAKDLAAGAVLILSLASLVVGAIFFLPPLIHFELRPGGGWWALALLALALPLHLVLRRFPLAFDPAPE